MTMIRVEDLHYSYGGGSWPALKGISYDFNPGMLYVITGPNGSGKSTFLNCINGSLRPDRGRILINGKNNRDFSRKELARLMAFVPQDTVIDFDFTVQEVVLMGRYPYLNRFRDEGPGDLEAAAEAMKKTGIFSLKDKHINKISGGERQRAVLAMAFAQETPILLLDEPVSMLDLYYQVSIMNTVKRMMQDREMTVIAVLHDLNLAARYGDRILLMDQGKIFTEGKPHDVCTPGNIKAVYNVDVDIINDDKNNEIFIKPVLNREG